MRAGTLNRRISIKDKGTITRTEYGTESPAWDDTVCTVWANIAQAGGREMVEAQQGQATQGWRIRMRYQPDLVISPKMRVHYGARVFEIDAVSLSLNERRRETVLSCTEIVDEA